MSHKQLPGQGMSQERVAFGCRVIAIRAQTTIPSWQSLDTESVSEVDESFVKPIDLSCGQSWGSVGDSSTKDKVSHWMMVPMHVMQCCSGVTPTFVPHDVLISPDQDSTDHYGVMLELIS
ncbi:unnamed protein product [Fusarium graminearum]|uniref:Chromosome 2, complete genome n=1 Tax=Gibberella zeae (strain ATCC MYA-4620 / CBS 123657 / FGSC 9075 / NRRL 31084 / PH-1) TaxID=229533 RepID=I1S6C2_GIBZE|nr:hypothetical protein FGSG_12393 [Fusarium graminearum PH-1]ESU09483.1 hypothetical protein FGSG_12393 [Fusarium graminearum PH-1]CEF78565.1 unnamed protein product [Fusarium graminearum]CZS81858.1 unnamed protein product [Fusarium graminearum]|eukprot:XP_011321982.1 hypothetical protein FGSG_12393 [Fusarium graminearum PH-1]